MAILELLIVLDAVIAVCCLQVPLLSSDLFPERKDGVLLCIEYEVVLLDLDLLDLFGDSVIVLVKQVSLRVREGLKVLKLRAS